MPKLGIPNQGKYQGQEVGVKTLAFVNKYCFALKVLVCEQIRSIALVHFFIVVSTSPTLVCDPHLFFSTRSRLLQECWTPSCHAVWLHLVDFKNAAITSLWICWLCCYIHRRWERVTPDRLQIKVIGRYIYIAVYLTSSEVGYMRHFHKKQILTNQSKVPVLECACCQ